MGGVAFCGQRLQQVPSGLAGQELLQLLSLALDDQGALFARQMGLSKAQVQTVRDGNLARVAALTQALYGPQVKTFLVWAAGV